MINIFTNLLFSFLLRNQFSSMLPKSIPKTKYKLQFTEGSGDKKLDWINVKFTLHDVICFISCATLGTFYLYSKVIFLLVCSYFITIIVDYYYIFF